jgi:type VI secretion system protein ImpH
VIAQLLDEPHRFQFVQIINILLRLLRRQGVSYDDAFRNVLRFRNSLSLTFPASEVQALEVEPRGSLARLQDAALQNGEVMKIRITPAFIGLLGAAGTLPLHDTERLAARLSLDGDASQHELIDVFSNRMIALFYEAWGKYRVDHGMSVRGQDRLLPMLTALAGVRLGVGARGQAGGGARAQDETVAYYAGLLGTRPISAGTVERVLSDHFGVTIRLEQFVGAWHPIPENRRSTLGTAQPILGRGVALGTRLWRHDLRARLHIGTLDEAQVSEFLPGGRALRALEEMVKLFAVPMLRYEVRLHLSPPCIKRMTLAKTEPRRLGWNTFLTGTVGVARRPEVNLMLRQPMSPRRVESGAASKHRPELPQRPG